MPTKTFIDDTHQLNMIYRRTDVQHEVSKFFCRALYVHAK